MESPIDAFDRRNLLTYLSLFCGVGALASASMGRASWTSGAIAAAVIADTFDGRFARLFGSDVSRRRLGGELDSLADAIVFGAVPVACALLLTSGAGPVVRALLWISGCAYAACAITRLAFFNITSSESHTGFVGIPAPVAALIWSSALLAHPSASTLTAVLALTSVAMVAPLQIRRPTGVGLAVFTCWPVVVLTLAVLGF